MKVQRKVTPTTIVEVEGETVRDCFEALAMAEDVFSVDRCGLCGATGVRHVVRHVDKYTYYEARCPDEKCRGKLSFGQPREGKGGLFQQRKDKEGNYKPHGGWERWEGKTSS